MDRLGAADLQTYLQGLTTRHSGQEQPVSAQTFNRHFGTLRNLFGWLERHEEVERNPMEKVERRRNLDGLTTSTTNRYLATLKTLFKTACNWDYITENPTSRLKMLKEQSRVPDALSDNELDALIAECPERTRHVVIIAADTGMRRSELQRLAWRDVDFETGTVTVRQSKNKDYRVIPMTDRVRSLLMRLKTRADRTGTACNRIWRYQEVTAQRWYAGQRRSRPSSYAQAYPSNPSTRSRCAH